MDKVVNTRLFYGLCAAFIAVNSVAIAMDFVWLNLIPYLLIFAFLVLFRLDTVLLTLCFLVPLSVNIDNVGFGLGISLPDEPLIMGIMCLAVFKFIIHAEYDYRVFRHPLTIAILLNMTWVLITCFTSELPVVSFKYFLSRFWYVVVFYFLSVVLFSRFRNITRYLWLYMIPLVFAVLYTLRRHSAYNFDQHFSFEITKPFYVAHGVYGAAIAFFLPVAAIFVLFRKTFHLSRAWWLTAVAFFVILFIGLVYSYTRASWISIAAAAAALVPLLLRIRLNTILALLIGGALVFVVFQNQILYVLSKNNDESSKNFSEHISSISNVSSDASNAERINRWVSAWRMFEERPLTGFGPGTYSFVYGPFQLNKFRTVISTDFGNGGNSHSEYLGPLCESGLLGLLTTLIMIYYALSTAFRLYYTAHKKRVRLTALAVMLGLLTYFVHGVMNNYSETDKIAILWWGGFAMLTAMDLYHNRQPEQEKA